MTELFREHCLLPPLGCRRLPWSQHDTPAAVTPGEGQLPSEHWAQQPSGPSSPRTTHQEQGSRPQALHGTEQSGVQPSAQRQDPRGYLGSTGLRPHPGDLSLSHGEGASLPIMNTS